MTSSNKQQVSFYGTLEPFASESVYFLMTDRFDDGDPSNNFEQQGGEFPSFRGELTGPNGDKAYVGYMGGDFKGILNNADYIHDMGFTAIWLTPIVDQPDAAFNGGETIEFGGAFKDGGKSAYHGYWGSNFFKVDEHLPSSDLSFKQLTTQLKDNFGIKTVLDIVTNHGSPAFTLNQSTQGKYGKLFGPNGKLVADHQNLSPEELDVNNPLHQFYNTKKDIMQLSDLNENNPAVLDYFSKAYLHWIDQGASAFRIDTIKHMPHHFWKRFSDRIRDKHNNFFMFAESFSFDADFIAQHTLEKNGALSVLDFPGRESMLKVFENPDSDFAELDAYLYLEDGPYANPYELMTYYDNHDMSRLNATENGFIDAHNWLFTARGIPVVYYGSEVGFMAGKLEHQGNRNYFGSKNIKSAPNSRIHQSLTQIGNIRKRSIALQKGLQINIELSKNKASFYRIFEHHGKNQTALVLLNKGEKAEVFEINKMLSNGKWVDAKTEQFFSLDENATLSVKVEPHDMKVLLLNQKNKNIELIALANQRMK
ncbi:MAG: hypothetical protein KUG78_08170 [Kangiellaceae bacterium]|nr:hypothetical protein [Kangiellaceae bacterium]